MPNETTLLSEPLQTERRPDGRRGDQYVQVKINVPDKLGEKQESLLKEFAELTDLKY